MIILHVLLDHYRLHTLVMYRCLLLLVTIAEHVALYLTLLCIWLYSRFDRPRVIKLAGASHNRIPCLVQVKT